jgi:Zn-dependent protease
MIIQIRSKIPVTIFPTFWLCAALIGYLNSQSFIGTLIWMGIIVVSVLFHEMGHALTALHFKQRPRIELVALGGLTYHEGQGTLSLSKQFFIVLNGPLFGLCLALIASLLLQIPLLREGIIGSILSLTRLVNFFWTIVNLIPVLPLDGGQLLRIIMEKIWGVQGIRRAMLTSLIIAVGISGFFFLTQAFLIGALFFLFAFQSYDLFRKTRHLSETDRKEGLRSELEQLEILLRTGKKREAEEMCQKILSEAHEGVIFETATQYLALLKYEEGKWEEVYHLLNPLRSELSSDALCLLHHAAFIQKDFPLVKELASPCFQIQKEAVVALRNACAHAQLKETAAAVGWIQTACEEGLDNLREALASPLFDPVRTDPTFQTLYHI